MASKVVVVVAAAVAVAAAVLVATAELAPANVEASPEYFPYCAPRPGMKIQECSQKVYFCGLLGITMGWVGHSVCVDPVTGGSMEDGGCQCWKKTDYVRLPTFKSSF